MKKLFLFSAILFACSGSAIAQLVSIGDPPPAPPEYVGPGIDKPGFPYMGYTNVSFPLTTGKDYNLTTLIDGNNISGTPFMIDEWREGTILLKNGTRYNNYKLKYDSYHQELLFLNGETSMVVTDPVQEFIIADAAGDPHHFINADMYGYKGKTQFFEILVDDIRGHLLKANHMIVATADPILHISETQYLKPTEEYYYYDISSGKTTSFNLSSVSVQKALQLSPAQQSNISFESYHFNDEADLMKFFKLYLQS